jgi:hypothetical protein
MADTFPTRSQIEEALARARIRPLPSHNDIDHAVEVVSHWASRQGITDKRRLLQEIVETLRPDPDGIEGSKSGNPIITTQMEYDGSGYQRGETSPWDEW